MGIRQQKRPDAPRPEVKKTDYGAEFVKAATETKQEETIDLTNSGEPSPEEAVRDENTEVEVEEQPVEVKKKKSGRPKKKK